jgi:hypothetical protein
VELFMRVCIPFLKDQVGEHRGLVLKVFKVQQNVIRLLQHICSHGKATRDATMSSLVPPLRKTLEVWLYKTRDFFLANNGHDSCISFRVGTLATRDIHGNKLKDNSLVQREDELSDDLMSGDDGGAEVDRDVDEEEGEGERPDEADENEDAANTGRAGKRPSLSLRPQQLGRRGKAATARERRVGATRREETGAKAASRKARRESILRGAATGKAKRKRSDRLTPDTAEFSSSGDDADADSGKATAAAGRPAKRPRKAVAASEEEDEGDEGDEGAEAEAAEEGDSDAPEEEDDGVPVLAGEDVDGEGGLVESPLVATSKRRRGGKGSAAGARRSRRKGGDGPGRNQFVDDEAGHSADEWESGPLSSSLGDFLVDDDDDLE